MDIIGRSSMLSLLGVKGLNDVVQSLFQFMIMEGRKLGYLHDMS